MVTSKTLSLFDNFNQFTPYAVGFDRVFDTLNRYVDNNVQSTGFFPLQRLAANATILNYDSNKKESNKKTNNTKH